MNRKNWIGPWILMVFSMALPLLAGAEPVWVSTTIAPDWLPRPPSSFNADNNGELWASFYEQRSNKAIFSLSSTQNGYWTNTLLGWSWPSLLSPFVDRAIAFDALNTPHVCMSYKSELYYVQRVNEQWEEMESLRNTIMLDLISATIEVDHNNRPSIAFIDSRGNFDRLVYCHRISGNWNSTDVFQGYNMSLKYISMAINENNDPILAVSSTGTVQVYGRSNNVWSLFKSFPSPWGNAKMRIDRRNRTHLLMATNYNGSGILARYQRWDSAGTVEIDQTFPLSTMLLNPTGDYSTSLAIDKDDNPRFLVGSTAFDLFGSSVSIPVDINWISDTKMVLVNGIHPFYLVDYSNWAGRLALITNTVGGPPSSPVLVERSTHSLSWSFSLSTGSVIGYQIIRVSDGAAVSNRLPLNTTFYAETGLSSNESREYIVRAVFPGFVRDSLPGPKIFTLARPAQDLKILRSGGNNLSVSWTAEGNSPGTVYRLRLVPPAGPTTLLETSNLSAELEFLDPSIPFALTLAAVNGNGREAAMSTLTSAGQDAAGPRFSFSLLDNLQVDLLLRGSSSGPQPRMSVVPTTVFPAGTLPGADYTPTGVGFEIPTTQGIPPGQTLNLTLHDSQGRVQGNGPFILARYDADRTQWVPLATQWDKVQKTFTAATRSMGFFQVMQRASLPTDLNGARIYPNPFRPSLHTTLAIQEVPAGVRARIYTDGGRLVREWPLEEGTSGWDGRDNDLQPVHSGVYVLQLDHNGSTQRLRFVVER